MSHPRRHRGTERNQFGDLLSRFRIQKGLTQGQLAQELVNEMGKGSRSSIDGWERGEYLLDTRETVLALAHILSLSEQETDQLLLAAQYAPKYRIEGNTLSTTYSEFQKETSTNRPKDYLPFIPSPLFQPRPGEFENLGKLLFSKSNQQPARLGLVGMLGMAGVGKTQLAVELAYRYRDHFPDGIFWMTATGVSLHEWQSQMAELVTHVDYLPPNDDILDPENEIRRVHHLCRYLATHQGALLILDNVEEPSLVTTALPYLAGGEMSCTIVYTSRNTQKPADIITYDVKVLPEEAALRLLLELTRPALLSRTLAGSQDTESKAAREICREVGYLPLGLIHLHGYLVREKRVTLVRLTQILKERGIIELGKEPYLGTASIFSIFWLSWEKERDEAACRLFKLAAYYPEAAPIPLWVVGLAANLGEDNDVFEPLGKARLLLQEMNLIEELSADQIRLHPLVREFARQLVTKEGAQGELLLEEAAVRVVNEFENLNFLERRARRMGYWKCIEQTKTARIYVELLKPEKAVNVRRVERWLDLESYIFSSEMLVPATLEGLFYQQLYNRSLEEDHPFVIGEAPRQWIRQLAPACAEDQSLLRILSGHQGGSVWSAAFSPDGSMVASAADDGNVGTVRLWDVVSGKKLQVLHGGMYSVAFSPDGKKIASGSLAGAVLVWDVETGKAINVLTGHREKVRSVVFSPDGTKLASGSSDGTVRVWDVETGNVLRVLKKDQGTVWSVVFSPDGTKLASGSSNGTVWVWDVESSRLLYSFFADLILQNVAFSPDGEKLAAATSSGVKFWEVSSGKYLWALASDVIVRNLAFSSDGRKIVTGCYDDTVRIWDVESRKQLQKLMGHYRDVRSVAFSPDGRMLASGAWDGTVRLWQIGSVKEELILGGHQHEVECVAFSPDGKMLASGAEHDEIVLLWDVKTGKKLKALEGKWLGGTTTVSFSPDGKMLAIGVLLGTLRVWTLENMQEIRVWEVGDKKSEEDLPSLEHKSWTDSIAFSPDGTNVISGCEDYTLGLWDVESGKKLKMLKGHQGTVECVVVSPDGTKIASGSADETIRVWEAKSGKLLRILRGHQGWVESVEFSPDGTKIVSGSRDRTILIWEVKSGKLVSILDRNLAASDLKFSPNGQLILASDDTGWISIWRVSESKKDHLLGVYHANYPVGSAYWQDNNHVVLADYGGPSGRPYFYHLKLEGMEEL